MNLAIYAHVHKPPVGRRFIFGLRIGRWEGRVETGMGYVYRKFINGVMHEKKRPLVEVKSLNHGAPPFTRRVWKRFFYA